MPARKVFWENPYLTEADAVVTSVEGNAVTLDRTIFFAFSGGQQSDMGTIGGNEVIEARKEGLELRYILQDDHNLKPGDAVVVRIDWERRYRLMRLHFAAELVLELVYRRLGRPEKAGANISPDKARLDFVLDSSLSGVLPELKVQLEALVREDLEIESAFSDVATEKRFWRIESFGQVPCGGTHPRRTGEIGKVKMKRTNPGKGLERIEITLEE